MKRKTRRITPLILSALGIVWLLTAHATAQAGARLVPGQTLSQATNLAAGVYEWQITGSGQGLLNLKGGGQERTLRVVSEPGIYGLLFETETSGAMELSLQLHGVESDFLTITANTIKPATPDQLRAWEVAKESFARLGYYGIDAQRPAPGGANAAVTQADLARSAIRETVVYYDPGYDSHWIHDDAGVAAYFTRRGLPAKNAKEAAAWLKARSTGDLGVGTSIIFTMGSAPDSIVYPPFADCLLAQYLRAGGRVVWLANVPMYVAQGEKGPFFTYGTTASEQMLGLTTDRESFYGLPGPALLTAAGQAWGLKEASTLTRPVHARGVTIPFVTDSTGKYCGVGLVNLRPDVPLSGFIFVPDGARPSQTSLLANVYRLARYSGVAVTVPDAAPLPTPSLPLEVTLRFGTDDQRFVYQRGEVVPLFLRVRALNSTVRDVQIRFALREGDRSLATGGAAVSVGTEERDQLVGHFDLAGLRMGRYTVALDLEVDGKTLELSRELRVAPPPDHGGTYVGIWCDTSPKQNRTEHLLDDLAAHNLEPMFSDENRPLGRDLALWYGFSFSSRHHGEPAVIPHPPGYDDSRLGGTGGVMRVLSLGDKRISRGYASPFRRQAEADDFARFIAFDNSFPAFRRRTATVDDYSQWLGLDYNRFAVEGFRARYGIEAPRPPGTEDPRGMISVARAPGIIPDDDPWILLARYWSETYGDLGRRLARAMESASGGTGKVGPVPGGMQWPVMTMGTGQYPPFNFGAEDGFNLLFYYYYNSFWQPPMAHLWWLESARMGNRELEQWIMPDCYRFELDSYHRNSLWLMFAGGAQGISYFIYSQRKEGSMPAMKTFGAWSRRYGLLLEQLRPTPKDIALLVPFEAITYRLETAHELVYPFLNLLMAKADVEPVSPEELDANRIRQYRTVILAQTRWMRANTVRLLEDYIAAGGRVLVDSITAASIPIKGATAMDWELGKYGELESIAKIRADLTPIAPPVVDCDDPLMAVRRVAATDGTPGAWLVHNYTTAEFARLKAGAESPLDAAHALETELGYRRDLVTTTLTRPDDGRLAFDVFGGRLLDTTRTGGVMTVTVTIPKWEGMLVLFPERLPVQLEFSGAPTETQPGLPVVLNAVLLDASDTPVRMPTPLQLTVRDPRGQPNREYTRRLLATDGAAAHTIHFAVNDQRGQWTLELEDVLTGSRATHSILLK
ncbi:MAG TPA: hypothetical protein PKE12_13435 [Kiritimatiellia bacterium]|nr:hypothetical protein [Kiritimatiellia bacterium]